MTPRPRYPGRRTLTTSALSVAIAVALVSCGSSGTSDGGSPTSQAPLPAPRQTSPTATASPSSAVPTGAPAPARSSAAPNAVPTTMAPPTTAEPPTTAAAEPTQAPDAYRDPSLINVVVNKHRPLQPLDFVPSSLTLPQVPLATAPGAARLREDAAQALEEMFAAAASDGIHLTLVSGYRSYQDQAATYNHWVAVHGSMQRADGVSARPGFSEHQTGLAFDVGQADGSCTLQPCFRDTAAGQWMDEHAHRYGFILRYPPGSEQVTGFQPEYWHFRYVGLDISADMHSRGIPTLEEYLGLPAAPGYR